MTSIAPDTTTAGDTITPCPPPWLCKATIYAFAYWTPAAAAKDPAFASAHYAPLEREAPFASPEWGTPRGGLSMIQLIRYTETPTGPYDELVILPGSFEYPAPDGDKSGKKTLTAPRISRIYVSQRNTCWNGRKNWNIPKHLARFDIAEHADKSVTFKVYPLGEGPDAGDPIQPLLFQCTFKPWSYAPSFPISTRLTGMLGVNLSPVQPPLPSGPNAAVEVLGGENEYPNGRHAPEVLAVPGAEIVGTQRWCKVTPNIYSSRASLGWFDLEQPDGTTFPPGIRRWLIGAKLENATLTFDGGETWDTPEALNK